jgi:hypothetical protein
MALESTGPLEANFIGLLFISFSSFDCRFIRLRSRKCGHVAELEIPQLMPLVLRAASIPECMANN